MRRTTVTTQAAHSSAAFDVASLTSTQLSVMVAVPAIKHTPSASACALQRQQQQQLQLLATATATQLQIVLRFVDIAVAC